MLRLDKDSIQNIAKNVYGFISKNIIQDHRSDLTSRDYFISC